MDRYIFRRTALMAVLLTGIVFPAVSGRIDPLASLQSIQFRGDEVQTEFTIPRQGHAGPKAWSEGIGWSIKERAEIEYWIKRWSTDEGRVKFFQSQNRAFEFRAETRSILRNAGIPWELTSIPIVESNWLVNAVSSSGAVGPWQFMESTGRGRNLTIDSWRDERRDIWQSTEAAAKELLFSYKLFQDWLLTIAAYNAGPTRLRKLKADGNFSDFWAMLDEGTIPSETRKYVPQIIAVAYLQAHAGRMGLPIEWKSPTQWLIMHLPHAVSLNQFVQIPGIDEELLITANQELHHPVTPPSSQDYAIKIPVDTVDIAELKRVILDQKNAPERFWIHTVRNGDTLSGIATAYRIPLKELLWYNNFMDNTMLRIGGHIYIPGTSEPPEGIDSEELPSWQGKYHVKPGDSLWSIARDFGVTPTLLADVNYRPLLGLLFAGSVLRVPRSELNQ